MYFAFGRKIAKVKKKIVELEEERQKKYKPEFSVFPQFERKVNYLLCFAWALLTKVLLLEKCEKLWSALCFCQCFPAFLTTCVSSISNIGKKAFHREKSRSGVQEIDLMHSVCILIPPSKAIFERKKTIQKHKFKN